MRRNIIVDRSERLHQLPPYFFSYVERWRIRAKQRAGGVIDLGAVSPDGELPREEMKDIPREEGEAELRGRIEEWLRTRFRVDVNPKRELFLLEDVKQGLAHFSLAFINPGDTVIVPDPSHPVYRSSAIIAGAQIESVPLHERNAYLPNLSGIEPRLAHRAKLLFVGYPHNPTTAVADLDFFRETLRFARDYNLIVCHDASYSSLVLDQYHPPSFLQVRGGKRVGVEFHSLFFPWELAGHSPGFVIGHRDLIDGLQTLMETLESGLSTFSLVASLATMRRFDETLDRMRTVYASRRDLVVETLQTWGWRVRRPTATPFVWAKVPGRYSSLGFARMLLRKAGVVVLPGSGFGEGGEGYLRISLTSPEERLKEALTRIEKHSHLWQRRHRDQRSRSRGRHSSP